MKQAILQHLKIEEQKPSLGYLKELMMAYCKTVPWENLSKIVKKEKCQHPGNCIRLENEFWTQAMEQGTGGICYESNWAFYKLLTSLGFDCYLTLNTIADKSSVHTAIIVTINSARYIVDIGYPLYAPIPIVKDSSSDADAERIKYRSSDTGSNEYLVENFPHPKPYLYHLKDMPVSENDYLQVATADYSDTGLFLDRIIIRKIKENVPVRFDSEDLPYNIHQLQNGSKTRNYIDGQDLVTTLADYFSIDRNLITKAFEILGTGPGMD